MAADHVLLSSHGLDLVSLRSEHVAPVAGNITYQAIEEAADTYGTTPFELLNNSVGKGLSYAVLMDGRPVGATGIAPFTPEMVPHNAPYPPEFYMSENQTGLMWAVFTTDISDHKIAFFRASISLVNFYQGIFPILHCLVREKEVAIHQWLAFLGFTPVQTELTRDRKESYVRFMRSPDRPRPAMH